MSENLDQQLVSLIESAKAAGQDAYAFIQKQAPDLFDQLIRWKITEGVIFGVILVIATAAMLVIYAKIWKASGMSITDDKLFIRVTSAFVGLVIFIFLAGIGCGPRIMIGVKAYVAPKVVILETIAGVIRNHP